MNTRLEVSRPSGGWPASLVLAVAALVSLAAPGVRAESYPGTEYVSGKTGHGSKVKGVLVVEEGELRFQDKDGRAVFAIPMAQVTEARESREHDEGSFGRKMALGIFASKTEEFLTIKTQSADSAEAVIFKCKKKTAPGMAAKINFYARKLQEASAAPQP
jgi:hypothetical protein